MMEDINQKNSEVEKVDGSFHDVMKIDEHTIKETESKEHETEQETEEHETKESESEEHDTEEEETEEYEVKQETEEHEEEKYVTGKDETEAVEEANSTDSEKEITNTQPNNENKTPAKRVIRYRKTDKHKKFKCDICGTMFTQNNHMIRHRRMHTGEKPYVCEYCKHPFARSDKLRTHIRRMHEKSETWEQTGEETDSAPKRRRKRPKILDEDYEWGTIPPDRKATKAVKMPKKSKVAESENDDTPEDLTDAAYSLLAEVQMVDPDEVNIAGPKFECEECGKPFQKNHQLLRHQRTHTGVKPYHCETCLKVFARADALKRHMINFDHYPTKSTDEAPDGNETPKILNGNDTNKVDLENIEIGESPDAASLVEVTYEPQNRPFRERVYSCIECNQNFKYKYYYLRHMESHGKERSLYCDFCNREFMRHSHLVRHRYIHTGEKPFECDECEERFNRTDRLMNHKMKCHNSLPTSNSCRQPDEEHLVFEKRIAPSTT